MSFFGFCELKFHQQFSGVLIAVMGECYWIGTINSTIERN